MNNQKGFSLMELIIIITVVSIIATLAIPNLLAARRASHEASAISSLRNYQSAQMTYQATVGTGNFAGVSGGANAFGILANEGLLDSSLTPASPTDDAIKSGYRFFGGSYPRTASRPATHGAFGVPYITSGVAQTGARKFVVVTDGLIHGQVLSGGLWYTEVNGYYEIINPSPIGD